MEKFLKPHEAAKILGVSVATLRSYEEDGILPFEVSKTPKGHRRYPADGINALKGNLPTRLPVANKPPRDLFGLFLLMIEMPLAMAPLLLIISAAFLGLASFTSISFLLAFTLFKVCVLITALCLLFRKKNIFTRMTILVPLGIVCSLIGLVGGYLSLSLFAAYCAILFIRYGVQAMTTSNVQGLKPLI